MRSRQLLSFALLLALPSAPLLAQSGVQPAGFAFSMPPSADPSNYHPTLTFDVASVREAERGNGPLNMGIVSPPHSGQFSASSVPLQVLLQIAYGSGPFKIAGAPDWLNDRYFSVQAKSDHAVDDQLAKLSDDDARMEKLNMIQAMLADRFKLKAHWETRDGQVYNLTVAKGGLKMQPTKVAPTEAEGPNGAPAKPSVTTVGVHAQGSRQGIEIDGDHFTLRAVSAMLATQLNMPILDKTGLTGMYSFTFQFSRNLSNDPPPDAFPSIFTAVDEQLGLHLDSAHGPVDTLVIESIELPTMN